MTISNDEADVVFVVNFMQSFIAERTAKGLAMKQIYDEWVDFGGNEVANDTDLGRLILKLTYISPPNPTVVEKAHRLSETLIKN